MNLSVLPSPPFKPADFRFREILDMKRNRVLLKGYERQYAIWQLNGDTWEFLVQFTIPPWFKASKISPDGKVVYCFKRKTKEQMLWDPYHEQVWLRMEIDEFSLGGSFGLIGKEEFYINHLHPNGFRLYNIPHKKTFVAAQKDYPRLLRFTYLPGSRKWLASGYTRGESLDFFCQLDLNKALQEAEENVVSPYFLAYSSIISVGESPGGELWAYVDIKDFWKTYKLDEVLLKPISNFKGFYLWDEKNEVPRERIYYKPSLGQLAPFLVTHENIIVGAKENVDLVSRKENPGRIKKVPAQSYALDKYSGKVLIHSPEDSFQLITTTQFENEE